MQLAFYKGPASTFGQRLFHRLVCMVTGGRYSHVELVIDGVCHSASSRDGGVRSKVVDFSSGRWDLVDLPAYLVSVSADDARAWFAAHNGQPYDTPGLLGFLLPWRVERPSAYFCSEAVMAALGYAEPWQYSPADMDNIFSVSAA